MISYTNPAEWNRNYLSQWFLDDTLVISDAELYDQDIVAKKIDRSKFCVLDLTHNPYPENIVRLHVDVILTNNFDYYYHPQSNFVFFPIWLYMYSLRANLNASNAIFDFDAGYKKTKPAMCLNKRPDTHRTLLWDFMNQHGVIDQIAYSFSKPHNYKEYPWPYPLNLPDEDVTMEFNDVSVRHPVYNECAVNIVTETTTRLHYISEKTCKAFMARQIPIIVGCQGINQALVDFGLDMFDDVVPWRTWDNELHEADRVKLIAEFVAQWIRSGNILSTYQSLLPRIERNKQYFHSESFRNRIMAQMKKFEPKL